MLEAIFEALLQVLFEILVRLPGFWIMRCFLPAEKLPQNNKKELVAGILFWLAIGGLVYLIIRHA